MAVSLEIVVKQLTDSAIIAPGTLENFVPPKASPKDGEELLRDLYKQGLLSKFQAQQVAANKVKALILGNYTLLDRIGAGGMGQVFKAEHRRMKRLVAIKMLPKALLQDAAAAARFQREVEAAAKLSHPNIVAAYDADEANGVHFLVMEYVEGSDLSVLVKKNGPLPVGKAVNYILQAAKGLEFAHGKGVIHRDIKPANLLLAADGSVKILDMGLARIASDGPAQTELTGSGTIMGTVDFMSPEQALNTKYADHRADIYSLGISLYYLLAGKMAYGGESAMEKLMAHQMQPIPSLQDVQTTVPKALDAIFKKMVAKKIEDRYQSMGEVIEALEELGIGGSATVKRGEIASTLALSPEQKKKLAATAKKKPLSSLTDSVASEKTKHLVAKIVGGAFATIIAPILVAYLIRNWEKQDEPPKPPAAVAEATTVPPGAAAGTSQDTSPKQSAGSQSKQPWNTPAFQAWMKDVAAMPAEKQVDAVSKKLMELNPEFDGKVTSQIEKNIVTTLGFFSDHVTDISPVRALAGLKKLSCTGSGVDKGNLSDLSPLAGMPLTELNCGNARVFDLSPLKGMLLTRITCGHCQISDLSPLAGMPLTELGCGGTRVLDLSPLKGMRLTVFDCWQLQISDLSPLAGMPLTNLNCGSTRILDLSPLKGMLLTNFNCGHCQISDLAPLHGMPLGLLDCFDTRVADLTPLEACKNLRLLSISQTKVTPTGVAALQTALPNCKITWDDPAKPKTPVPTASGTK